VTIAFAFTPKTGRRSPNHSLPYQRASSTTRLDSRSPSFTPQRKAIVARLTCSIATVPAFPARRVSSVGRAGRVTRFSLSTERPRRGYL